MQSQGQAAKALAEFSCLPAIQVRDSGGEVVEDHGGGSGVQRR